MTHTFSIYFQTNARGQKVAYRFSPTQLRSFRIGLAEAEALLATGQAVLLDGNPMKP